jgi:hypothetical protein
MTHRQPQGFRRSLAQKPWQPRDVGGDTLRFLVRIRAAINGRTLLPPHLSATRFPQKKILQDEFPITRRKRSTANATRDITVNGLRSGFGFDHLIKRVAMWALKMECRGFDHDMPPAPTNRCDLFSSTQLKEI